MNARHSTSSKKHYSYSIVVRSVGHAVSVAHFQLQRFGSGKNTKMQHTTERVIVPCLFAPVAYFRYKFVVDRAKRLLESSHLASLRQVINVDINPESYTTTPTHGTPRDRCHIPRGGGNLCDKWDECLVPSSQQRISGRTGGTASTHAGEPNFRGSALARFDNGGSEVGMRGSPNAQGADQRRFNRQARC